MMKGKTTFFDEEIEPEYAPKSPQLWEDPTTLDIPPDHSEPIHEGVLLRRKDLLLFLWNVRFMTLTPHTLTSYTVNILLRSVILGL